MISERFPKFTCSQSQRIRALRGRPTRSFAGLPLNGFYSSIPIQKSLAEPLSNYLEMQTQIPRSRSLAANSSARMAVSTTPQKRTFPSPRDALLYFLRFTKRYSRYLAHELSPDAYGDVDAINGAFMLVRRDAILDVGLLDEQFWMYGEDLDWCRRFWNAGWRIAYDGRVQAVHLKAASSGSIRPFQLNWQFHKSMILYLRKHPQGRGHIGQALLVTGILAIFAVSALLNAARQMGSE